MKTQSRLLTSILVVVLAALLSGIICYRIGVVAGLNEALGMMRAFGPAQSYNMIQDNTRTAQEGAIPSLEEPMP